MKIVKEGKRPSEKIYRGTCRACSTEVEFERQEAEFHSDQRDGDYLTVRCPICSRDIITSA